MKLLIIANARYKDGLSGSDNIYRMFACHWPISKESELWTMMNIDFRPFFLCYIVRVILGTIKAIHCKNKFDLIYSASDFWADCIPAWIMKIKGQKWVAGFFMQAPESKPIYYYSQKLSMYLIRRFADMVICTNTALYRLFPDKKKIWINGGIDFSNAGIGKTHKRYDCVFVGRIHPSKGIDKLVWIWDRVLRENPSAQLAVIGDGDLGIDYLRPKLKNTTFFGFLDEYRFNVYRKSKVVIYPTTKNHDHFSMSPVEAMACGCPLVAFKIPSVLLMNPMPAFYADNIMEFVKYINYLIHDDLYEDFQNEAYDYATQFEEKKEALRVWDFIERELK